MVLSQNELRERLRAALPTIPKGYQSVADVWPDHFVYSLYDGDREVVYRRDYTISPEGAVQIGEPTEVRPVTNYEVVVFSGVDLDLASFSGDEAPEAKLFKIGRYPDKDFELTVAEADAAVAAFSPFPVMLEHGKTAVGEAEFGMVRGMRRSGDWLVGPVAIADNVRKALKGTKPKLSMSWHRDTKRPRECSIVNVPHVVEAGLVAAFSGTPVKDVAPARTGPLMSLFDKIKAGLGLNDSEAAELNANFSASDRIATLETEKKELENRLKAVETSEATPANFAANVAKTQAERIVQALEDADKISPAEREKAVASFSAAIAAAPAEFSATGDYQETELVKSMREGYEAREPHLFGRRLAATFSAGSPAAGKDDVVKPLTSVEACSAFAPAKPEGRR